MLIHSSVQKEAICITPLAIVYKNIVQIYYKLPVLRNDELW